MVIQSWVDWIPIKRRDLPKKSNVNLLRIEPLSNSFDYSLFFDLIERPVKKTLSFMDKTSSDLCFVG